MKKKCTRFALLFFLAVALCSITALAAGGNGVYDIQGTDVTITPKTAGNTAITATPDAVEGKDLYQDAERFDVTVSNTSTDAQYLIVVTKGTAVPTQESIVYIDQKAGTGSDVTFEVYPSSLEAGFYSVWLTSTAKGIDVSGIPAGSFQYYMSFIVGDANGDKDVTIDDALAVLNHLVKNSVLTGNNLAAADVTGDGDGVTIDDALRILNFVARNITSLT